MSAAVIRFGRRLGSEKGVTLMEMMVSIAVLGIFFAAFATVVGSTIGQSSQIQEQSVLQTEVRAAADALVADLRQATQAGDTSLLRVSTATSTQLTFLSPDRGQPLRLRRIAYQVTGGQLQRARATSTNTASPWSIPALSAWSTVARGILTTATPFFTYYDGGGAVTSVAANVRAVKITFSVAPTSNGNKVLLYTTRVSLRPAA